VIDDEKDARTLVSKILQKAGAEVSVSASAEEAIEAYKEHKTQVILSDIGLPEEDGYSFIRRLRENEARERQFTPAIALTAYSREEDRNRALAAGYQQYLTKPIESARLINAVADLQHSFN
jgi:CheY-like chemotaxis protein